MPFNILSDFLTDLHDPRVWWQVAAVGACVAFSYVFSRWVRARFPVDERANPSEQQIAQTFFRLVFPSLTWLLLFLAKIILVKYQHVNLLALLIPIFGSLALIRFGIYLSRRIFADSIEIGPAHLLVEKIFTGVVCLIVILFYSGFLPDIVKFLDENTIVLGRSKLSFLEILQALFSVVLTVLLALWAGAALEKKLMNVGSMHLSLRLVLSRLGRTLLILFAILVSLSMVGIDLTVLSVFGGALGVGLGLGLQKIASNYVSGFIILLDRSLSINDLITVDKYNGKVTEINTRYTVLKGLDGVESIIPNEMLVSSPVQNLSLTDRAIWLSTDVCVGYDTDIEKLIPQLEQLVWTVPRVSSASKPSANLMNLGANGLELRIGFWLVDPENGKGGAISDVNRAIWKLLKEQNIEVPFPQHEVKILNPDQK